MGNTSKKMLFWLWAGTLLINAAVAVLAYGNLKHSHELTESHVRQVTSNLAELLDRNLSDSARRIDLALQTIADNLELRLRTGSLSDVYVEEILERHRGRLPEADVFRVSRKDGMIWWGQGVDRTKGETHADREFYQAHLANPGAELVIGEPIIGRLSKKWVIPFTRSFREPDGSLGGTVVAAVPISYLFNQLSGLELGPHGTAVIRHINKSLITRYPPVEAEAGKIGNTRVSPEFEAVLASGKGDGFFHSPLAPDGIERTYAFRRLDVMPAIVTVGLATDDYLDAWRRELHMTLLGVVTIAILSILANLAIGRFLRRQEQDSLCLQQSEARLKTYIEHAPIGIYVANMEGFIEDANPAIENLVGLSRQSLLGQNLLDFAPENAQTQYQTLLNQLQHSVAIDAEVPVLLPDKSQREVSVHVATLPSGKILGFVFDITEQKQAAKALMEYQNSLEKMVADKTQELQTAYETVHAAKLEADKASHAKSAFLANMSHEIRTPLNAINGLIHLIKRSGTTEDQAVRLSKMEVAGEHLLEIINAVLDLSKIEAGKLTLENVHFNLDSVTDNVSNMLRERAHAKNLMLKVENQATPYGLIGDATRIQQGLINYVSNAIKFTEQGQITLRSVVEREDENHALVRFEVEDTGVGIAEETLGRLFNAFEQADNSTTRQYGGTGLGLAITKHLARLMGGEAGASSSLGAGSMFWFSAKLAKSSQTPLSDTAATNPELILRNEFSGHRILVVDDEPINSEITASLLDETGLFVDVAIDGLDSLQKVAEVQYDLILMDMQMPNMDGLDATRIIRQMEGYAETPIVAMTANAFAEDRIRCQEAGMTDFLAKPFKPDALYEALIRLLRNPS